MFTIIWNIDNDTDDNGIKTLEIFWDHRQFKYPTIDK